MKMLIETLERGNRALAAMYRQTEAENETKGSDDETVEISAEMEERDIFRTRRLRRKLARTLINIAHVHFFNCNYDAAMASLRDAIPILNRKTMTGRTLAAVWYNMSMVFYHQGNPAEALTHLDKFLELAVKFNGPDHLQNADALYRKAQILLEMGNTTEAAMEPIEECLRIRKLQLGEGHGSVAEALCLKGKMLLPRRDYDGALQSLNACLEIQRKQLNSEDLTFEVAQTLLEIGQAHHVRGEVDESLEKYMEVLEWTRKFFGPNHPFVARIDGIIGNIYVESGKMDESKPFLDEAAKIQKELQNTSIAATS
jgi:tetratricopeptide (TPR) repeat protein